MATRYQTTIPALMRITLVAAIWFALYRVSANVAWQTIGCAALIGIVCMSGRMQSLFWLPPVACVNWIILAYLVRRSPWTSLFMMTFIHELFIVLALVVVSMIAIASFTIHRTRLKFRNRPTRRGVIWLGIRNSVLSGVYVGMLIALPLVMAGIASRFVWSPVDLKSAGAFAILLPTFGLHLGLLLSIVLCFVCDIIVTIDFRKRPRPTQRNNVLHLVT